MLFNQTQKKRLQIIMDMDEQLRELEPLFYSEINDGELDQLVRVKNELQRLANMVMEDAIRNGNGKSRKVRSKQIIEG